MCPSSHSPFRSSLLTVVRPRSCVFSGADRYYTWIADPINYDGDLEFVPLLWGDEESIKNWDKSMKNLFKKKKNTVAVMGMNECLCLPLAFHPTPLGNIADPCVI